MKKTTGLSLIFIIICAISMLMVAGCGESKSGNTIDEPDITVEYLTDEYSQQLITDGAGTMLGFVSLEKSGDSYTAHITEKEVVASSAYSDGYYIADTNVSLDATLGSDARLTFMDDDAEVITADEFIERQDDDSEQLYMVYLMGDSAELVLAVDPSSVISE